MLPSRLDLIAADIGRSLGPSHACAVALMGVRAAFGAHPCNLHVVQEVMKALESGDWRTARAHRAGVEAIAAQLDEQYLASYRAAREQNTPAVVEAFSQARAVEALALALGPDEETAAKESLYEAHASLGDVLGEELLSEVRRALGTA